ncbi:hypothetical protein LTR96_011717, partial [Exophiala xenobiotica]
MADNRHPSASGPIEGLDQPTFIDPDVSMKAARDEVDANSDDDDCEEGSDGGLL